MVRHKEKEGPPSPDVPVFIRSLLGEMCALVTHCSAELLSQTPHRRAALNWTEWEEKGYCSLYFVLQGFSIALINHTHRSQCSPLSHSCAPLGLSAHSFLEALHILLICPTTERASVALPRVTTANVVEQVNSQQQQQHTAAAAATTTKKKNRVSRSRRGRSMLCSVAIQTSMVREKEAWNSCTVDKAKYNNIACTLLPHPHAS